MNYVISTIGHVSSAFIQVGPRLHKALPRMTQIVSKIGLSELTKIAFLYKLYDDALANILALETNRHGTSLYSYAKIHMQGAKVCYGGHIRDAYQGHSQNRIFVFKDHASFSENLSFSIKDRLSTFLCSMGYSQGAYSASMRHGLEALGNLGVPSSLLRPFVLPSIILSIPLGILSPTLKFRFTPEQLDKDFREDNEGGALYTEKDISPTHLGISGSLIQGVNFSIFKRIYNKPSKFILGCVQLTAAVALTCIYTGLATPFPLVNTSITIISEVMEKHSIIKNIALGALYTSTL